MGLYTLPKKNVLVVSCMDLRLTDNLVDFLHHDNLENRYDHFILAGASLAHSAPTPKGDAVKYTFNSDAIKPFDNLAHWRKSLYDHIALAVGLHAIEDIYIVEHQDCGAYTNLLTKGVIKDEKACHHAFADELADYIQKQSFDYVHTDTAGTHTTKQYKLHVHGFFIDLRGNVDFMFTKPSTQPKEK